MALPPYTCMVSHLIILRHMALLDSPQYPQGSILGLVLFYLVINYLDKGQVPPQEVC